MPVRLFVSVWAVAVVVKEWLSRSVFRASGNLQSTALKGDAWHHRADALTSATAFIGIGIAWLGGPGYEAVDDWAALAACGIIAWNGLRLLRPAMDEIMDASVAPEIVHDVRHLASAVPGVRAVEKCRVRKSGPHLSLDIHVQVDGEMTVRESHRIAHDVKDHLLASPYRINDVTVHIEPDDLPVLPP